MRDVRTELLVKLTLRDRAGLPRAAFVARQREHLAPMIDVLTARRRNEDLVDVWRRESARAVARFLTNITPPRN